MNNSVSRTMCIPVRVHDLFLILFCLLFIINRNIPIDISSLWRFSLLCIVYVISRIIPIRYYKFLFFILCFWGVVEVAFSMLQKALWLTSNHFDFTVTGTFGNPGPLGCLLAVSCLIPLYYIGKYLQDKKYNLVLLFLIIACFILFGIFQTGSRAALVSIFTGALFLFYPYLIKDGRSVLGSILVKILILLTIFVLVAAVYFLRKDSADGRFLIWYNTACMIKDYPFLGFGSGGWLANYMHYQADFFINNQDSTYAMLADNTFYPYNEFLYMMAEQGLVGMLLVLSIIYVLVNNKEVSPIDRVLKSLLVASLFFSFFSYPASIFSLCIVFTSIIRMLKSPIVKCIILSSFRVYVLASLFVVLVVGISSWSYSIYNKAYKRILVLANNEQTLDHCSDLNKLFPLFCYNPQLMYLYSQVCKGKCSLDQELSLLQAASKVAPTSDLYYKIGDIWRSKGDVYEAEKFYKLSISMIPHRITPKYRLFLLYIEQKDMDSAVKLGNIILRQPVKKEGTKILRMKIEVQEYLDRAYHNGFI